MIRVVQISDIHWRGLERHDEYQHVFNELYKKLKEIKPDIIINTGDTWHTKLQHITPEGFRMLRTMFVDLAQIAPVFNIYGNHDLNLQNTNRHNIMWEVIHSIRNEPDINPVILLDKSERIDLPFKDEKTLSLYPFSMTDTKAWEPLHIEFLNEETANDRIRIALFHGSIVNSTLQNGYKIKDAELDEENFLYDFPFVMLGDIHKRQFLAYRRNLQKEVKPYVGYAGSIVQQDFGETADGHGFLIWDFESEQNWNITEVDIENPYQMHSLAWDGIEPTLNNINELIKEKGLDVRASFRVQHGGIIFKNEVNEIKELALKRLGLPNDNLVFSYSKSIEEEIIATSNLELKPNIVVKSNIDLLYDYLTKAPVLNTLLREEDFPFIEQAIEKIEKTVKINDKENTGRLVWKIKELWFDNLFLYGEKNYIDFDKLNGNVGIFGSNRTGKSAILGAICYALFNTTDRGSMKDFDVINSEKPYARAKIRFEMNGVTYYIERMTTKKGKDEATSGKVNFYKINQDGVQEILNGGDRTDTDRKIRSLIGTFDDFESTSLAAQDSLLSFIKKGSTESKKTLSRYFNIDSYLAIGIEALEDKKKYTERVADRTENSWFEEKTNILEQLHLKRSEIVVLENDIDALTVTLESFVEQLTSLNVAEVNQYSTNKQLIERSNKDIEECKSQINQLEEDIGGIQKALDQANLDMGDLSKKANEYREVSLSYNKIKKELDSIVKEKEQQKKKLKLLDEIPCGDQFPTCSFIRDSFEAKSHLPQIESAEQMAMQSLSIADIALRLCDGKVEEEYQQAVRRQRKHSDALAQATSTIEIYRKKINKEEALVTGLNDRQVQIVSSGIELNIEEQIKNLSQKIDNQNKEITEKKTNYTKAIIESKELNDKSLAWEESFKEFSINLQKLRVMTVIAEAFSKNGIPAQILRDYMESVNFFASLVTKDTDFDVRVRIDSDSNSLDIDYIHNNKKRPIITCSGAEKTFASLALRVALIQCNSIPISNALFLDECFSALDDSMIIIAEQLLTSLESYFDSIFVISHETYIKEMLTNKIEILKGESGFSEIIHGEYNLPEWTEKFVL